MRMKFKFVLLFLASGLTAIAQKDSVKTEYSQEKITESGRLENSFCELLTKREAREKDLWKFNLLGTFFTGFNISYERKLAPALSLNIHSVTAFNNNNPAIFGQYSTFNNMDQQLSFDVRYYYDQKRRIRLNRRAGFTGGYFAFSLHNEAGNSVFYNNSDSPNYSTRHHDYYIASYLMVQWGYQWRLGKIGYIDTHIGGGPGHRQSVSDNKINRDPNNRFLYFNPDIHIGIGICF